MLYKNIISKDLSELKIFSLDSSLKQALVFFAVCCQIISGFTEFLGVAPFLIDLLKPLLSPTLSNTIGNLMAVSLALFLEFLVFYLVGFIIHALKAKYWNEGEGIDLVFNRIKFVLACSLLTVLIFVSMFLSKRNVRLQVATTKIEFEAVDLDHYDQKKAANISVIENRYLADKNDLDNSLADSKQLVTRTNTAKIDALNFEVNILIRKEQRTGNSYRTAKLSNRKKIAELRTNQAEQLQQLRQKYDNDLATLKHNRSNAIYAVVDEIKIDRSKASTNNDNTAEATAARNEWIGFVLQWIASCAVLGFVIARSWVCMSDATAGVEKKAMPLQESQGSAFWKELILLGRLKIQRRLQNGIRRKLATIPDLLPIEQTGALLSNDALHFIDESLRPSANVKDGETITKTIEFPTTSKDDLIPPSNDIENKLLEVISVNDLEGDTTCALNGCEKSFFKKNYRHLYCCNSHRIQAWELKTGQKFGKKKT